MKRESSIGDFWKNIPPGKVPGTTPIDKIFWDYLQEKDKLCEVGCGDGRLIPELVKRGFMVVCSDINKAAVSSLRGKIEIAGLKNRVSVLKDDICQTKLPRNWFAGVLMQGVLGSMAKKNRLSALKGVGKILNAEGVVHIAEFEVMRKPSMLIRYDLDEKITGEYGTLSIKDVSGQEIYRTHNFTEEELRMLIRSAKLKLISIKRKVFVSYHGRRKPGLVIVAQKYYVRSRKK